jgi:hypothetical protein
MLQSISYREGTARVPANEDHNPDHQSGCHSRTQVGAPPSIVKIPGAMYGEDEQC